MTVLSTRKATTGIYWFKHDLRLADNKALIALSAKVDVLVCVFIIDPRWFKASHFQANHMGEARWQFLLQSLECLQQQLALKDQRLIILEGQPKHIFDQLIDTVSPQFIASNMHPGVYERQQWRRLAQDNPHIHFDQSDDHFLLDPARLPFNLENLPDSFTPFRKNVEEQPISIPVNEPKWLPPMASLPSSLAKPFDFEPINLTSEFKGGAIAGLKQLNHYLFETHNIRTYKQTRNGLEGWDYSSKLSAWLANGCISPKQVFSALKHYESQHGANDSTYWLYFELLWRDYFQWYLLKHQSKVFDFSGVKNQRPLTTFLPQRFIRWCLGDTPYPIVNACMKQLNATGYMSNRGRQLVASCLVHELSIDWRFGAAYFEQQLIDFDVAANWGNWQYLAGVGADPRGHRRFNLDKQTATYDPSAEFITNWGGKSNDAPLDQTDAADWPIN